MLPRKRDRLLSVIYVLLEYCPHCHVRGVGHNGSWGMWFGVGQKSCVGEGILDVSEGCNG